MSDILEDYLRAVERSLRVPAREREQIIGELRAHVHDRAADLRASAPDISEADALRRALDAIGPPASLALAYNGGVTEVRSARGETLLRISRAVGRGTAKAIKWTAISIAFLLVLGSVVAYVAYQEAKPHIAREYSRTVYREEKTCSTVGGCDDVLATGSFDAPSDAHTVKVRISGYVQWGTLSIEIVDDEGAKVFEKTFARAASVSILDEQLTWRAADGPWKVTVTSTGYQGHVHIEARAIGARLE